MTEQQTVKNDRKKNSGVFLNDRFVHRDNIIQSDGFIHMSDPDEIMARLADYFALTQTELFSLPDSASEATSTLDDMPRFPQSHRDGLQVPKEGKDGTGN